MAQVAVTDITLYLNALHAVAVVKEVFNSTLAGGLGETGPAGDGVVLSGSVKQQAAAGGADVAPRVVGAAVGVAVGGFSAFEPKNLELGGCQVLLPFFFRLLHPAGWFRVAVFGKRNYIFPTEHRRAEGGF